MNNFTQDTLKKFGIEAETLDKNVLEAISALDAEIASKIKQINDIQTTLHTGISATQPTANNAQAANENEMILNNLKRAIASIEPKYIENINQQTESIDEATYLTQSLTGLIDNLVEEKAKLSQEKALDQSILEAIGDALVVTNTEGRVILTNHAFVDVTGFSKEEVSGQLYTELIKKFDHLNQPIPSTDRLAVKAIKDAMPYRTEPEHTYFYAKKTGETFPVTISVSPIFVNEKIVGVVEVFRDVTKEKEIDKAKSEFVSLASHQLRTPLSSINWYVEMLLDDNLEGTEDEYKSYLREIDTAAQRMVGMINALLNVSRLELGTFAIEPEAIDLLQLTSKIVAELKPKIEGKQINLTCNYNKDIPIIKNDPKLVSIIIQNLTTNAVKYTPAGGNVDITITTDKNREHIVFEIKDTGYGIPTSEQDKIFSKLFRASNIKKFDTDGNGLGLYILKLIIDNLEGQIWFESEEEKGSKFSFALPIHEVNLRKEGKQLS